jgi:hypothetical protein
MCRTDDKINMFYEDDNGNVEAFQGFADEDEPEIEDNDDE